MVLTGAHLCYFTKQSANLLRSFEVDYNSFFKFFELPCMFNVLTRSGGLSIPAKAVSVFWAYSHLFNLACNEVKQASPSKH